MPNLKHFDRYKPELPPGAPPPRVTRLDGAALLYRELGFPISPRTLESWPVPTMRANGKATYDSAELLAFARARMAATPVQRGGRNRT